MAHIGLYGLLRGMLGVYIDYSSHVDPGSGFPLLSG